MTHLPVVLYSPYSLKLEEDRAAGNTVTVLRMAGLLREAGNEVVVVGKGEAVPEGGVLIALNAWRSGEVVLDYQKRLPGAPVVVVLTGTDLTREVGSAEAKLAGEVMAVADRLVLLQEASLAMVRRAFHEKCVVIFPSVEVPAELISLSRDKERDCGRAGEVLEVVLAGNVRSEKNPRLVRELCALMGDDEGIRIRWFGAADEESEDVLREAESLSSSFQWMGGREQLDLWREMAGADVFLNVSREEGGANALCEAMQMGVPVLASRVMGNVGLLGEGYAGFFEVESARELLGLLREFDDDGFMNQLARAVRTRGTCFERERERDAWGDLIDGLRG